MNLIQQQKPQYTSSLVAYGLVKFNRKEQILIVDKEKLYVNVLLVDRKLFTIASKKSLNGNKIVSLYFVEEKDCDEVACIVYYNNWIGYNSMEVSVLI